MLDIHRLIIKYLIVYYYYLLVNIFSLNYIIIIIHQQNFTILPLIVLK